MSDEQKKQSRQPSSREDRLKQALRDNLKRRKSQARARKADGKDDGSGDPDAE